MNILIFPFDDLLVLIVNNLHCFLSYNKTNLFLIVGRYFLISNDYFPKFLGSWSLLCWVGMAAPSSAPSLAAVSSSAWRRRRAAQGPMSRGTDTRARKYRSAAADPGGGSGP